MPVARQPRGRWIPAKIRYLVWMALVVLALNVLSWGVLTLVVVPQALTMGNTGVFGVGLWFSLGHSSVVFGRSLASRSAFARSRAWCWMTGRRGSSHSRRSEASSPAPF